MTAREVDRTRIARELHSVAVLSNSVSRSAISPRILDEQKQHLRDG
jgi:hypothetical protein